MPALVYKVAEVEQRLELAQALPRTRRRILVRSILSNLLGIGSFVGWTFFTNGTTSAERWLSAAFLEAALLAFIFLLFLPRLEAGEIIETKIEYYQTILYSALGSWLSVPILTVIFLGVPKSERPSDLYLIAGWMTAAFGSAIIAALTNLRWHIRSLLGIGILLCTLGIIGAIKTPFQAVAHTLGIAPNREVTLLMGKNACQLITRAHESMKCDADGGALSHVIILNTLGNRWLISIDNRRTSIAVPADGLAYRIDSENKPNKSVANKK